jgi:acetoin utilization deacetylase AcuC-like enzyme
MGFCIFNNIAIAADSLIRQGLAKKIAIIDFDVHHGNGTQHAFYRRNDVFFISIHRTPFYPGSGTKDETGEGDGRGFTLNLPIHVSSGDDDYKNVFDTNLLPAVLKYKPDFIAVSAGFDAHVRDPLGGMRVTTGGYRWMAQLLSALANECCDGKLMYVLEGGYDLSALRDSSEVVLETLVES